MGGMYRYLGITRKNSSSNVLPWGDARGGGYLEKFNFSSNRKGAHNSFLGHWVRDFLLYMTVRVTTALDWSHVA